MHPLSTKSITNSPLMGLLKLDQIAFVARTDTEELLIKRMLRLDRADWVEDEVVANGYVKGKGSDLTNTAKLLFNYDLGIEIEILRYLEGENYVETGGVPSCNVAHLGFHLEKGKSLTDFGRMVFPAAMMQEVKTHAHTNEFLLKTGRRYRYTIYDTKPLFGVYLKVIERIEVGDE